jgi:hypothetical protein
MFGTLFSINLRGDLAKLSDSEIAVQFEQFQQERKEAFAALSYWKTDGNKWLYQTGAMMPLGRGLLRARIFYKLQAFLDVGSTKPGSVGYIYLIDCELRDLRDEIARRLKLRVASTK